jgi:hypothetical protein
MAVTQSTDLFSVQTLIDRVRGRFRKKNAFMGSPLVSSGAVRVLPTMPKGGKGALNKTIDVPYYGTLGGFVNNPEGSSPTPQKIAQASEQATIGRSSLMVETSVLAQGVAAGHPELGDPYQEAADQAMVAGEREMDRIITNTVKATPLIVDLYNASAPVYLEHRHVIQARSKWGDEMDDVVGMVTHSQALADLAAMQDNNGHSLLETMQMQEGQEGVIRRKFGGVPLTVSDSVPLDGSSMGTVTPAGTTPPVATLAVANAADFGPWDLVIDCVVGGAHQTATIRFSTDGGNTWSAPLTTLAAAAALELTDTAVDSLVGNNGKTGVTVAFAAGTFNADNTWSAKANLCVSSILLQPDTAIFWFNADRLGAKTDVDIAEDTDLFAMHLYYVSHMYRRRRMGSRCGAVRIKHNVRNYAG